MRKVQSLQLEVRIGKERVRGWSSRTNPLRIRSGRTALAFMPTKSAVRKTPAIAVYRIVPTIRLGRAVGRQIAEVAATRAHAVRVPELALAGQPFSIRVLGVGPRLNASDECCVTCDGTTACGCKVEMSCGSCCSGGCC